MLLISKSFFITLQNFSFLIKYLWLFTQSSVFHQKCRKVKITERFFNERKSSIKERKCSFKSRRGTWKQLKQLSANTISFFEKLFSWNYKKFFAARERTKKRTLEKAKREEEINFSGNVFSALQIGNNKQHSRLGKCS